MARVEVKLFASLRESVGIESQSIELGDSNTVSSLLACFAEQSVQFNDYYTNHPVLVAVNQSMVEHSHPINADDEVALFPPVTGG